MTTHAVWQQPLNPKFVQRSNPSGPRSSSNHGCAIGPLSYWPVSFGILFWKCKFQLIWHRQMFWALRIFNSPPEIQSPAMTWGSCKDDIHIQDLANEELLNPHLNYIF